MIVFDCGCIALDVTRKDKKGEGVEHMLIEACDAREEPLMICWRNMHSKGSKPLRARRVEELLNRVSSLVADGFKFREIKSLLGRS